MRKAHKMAKFRFSLLREDKVLDSEVFDLEEQSEEVLQQTVEYWAMQTFTAVAEKVTKAKKEVK